MNQDDRMYSGESSKQKRVLIVGASGQVGKELLRSAPADVTVTAADSKLLDIRSRQQVQEYIFNLSPHVVINSAAFTAVDKAESEIDLAYAVNAYGAGYVAEAAKARGARLIHVSTDYVFDGKKESPYLPNDTTNPLCVYGASKLEGEKLVSENMQNNYVILRTSWVYSQCGKNFVNTMLHLMRERDALNVVFDQFGSPTWAKWLSRVIWKFAFESDESGVFSWSDAGVTSWYEFAVAIQEEALKYGLLKGGVVINPVSSSEYPVAARRPQYSVFDNSKTLESLGMESIHWRTSLVQYLEELKDCMSWLI